ncbi:MAG: SEC-C domain-containing protein, partial [Pseudomonadota bacterium]
MMSPNPPNVPNKPKRNDKCWCGSGLKYKKCHLDRDKQERDNPWKLDEKINKAFKKRECLAPKSLKSECNGAIIAAHTVPKSLALDSISESGHVYSFFNSLSDLKKTHGVRFAKKVGVKKASVFFGFCEHHDQE